MSSEIEDETASIEADRISLCLHLGVRESPDAPAPVPPSIAPLFFVEGTPWATRPATCKLLSCGQGIRDSYRIGVQPGRSQWYYGNSTPEFFHISCLEKIADLSRAEYLDRIAPLNQTLASVRGLKESQILGGEYFCSPGMATLIYEWKMQRGRWIDGPAAARAEEPQEEPERTTDAPMAAFMRHQLSPIESEAEDEEPWDLRKAYLNPDEDQSSWHDRHHLSTVVDRWVADVRIVMMDENRLDERERAAKALMSRNAINGIKRLAPVHL